MSSRFLKPFKFLSLISSREKKFYCCLSFASFWAVTLKGTNTYRTHEDFPNLHIKPQTISLHLHPVSLQLPVSNSWPPATGFQPQASSFRLPVAILLLQAPSLRPPTLYYIMPPAPGLQLHASSPGLQPQALALWPWFSSPRPQAPSFQHHAISPWH